MTYLLVIWTAVAAYGNQLAGTTKYDWRPLAEFQASNQLPDAAEKCYSAAATLGLTPGNYRCVRTK